MARGGAAWALGVACMVMAGVAQGQDAPVRKPVHPKPPAPVVAPDAGSPPSTAVGPDGAGAQVTPLPGADRLRVGPAVSATPALRSAVRSRWSVFATIAASGGGTCRAQCAASRISCLAPGVDEAVPHCNAAWTSCLSSCTGLAYGRARPAP